MVMNEKKTQLSDLMASSMDKIREMVDSNTIIGQPIVTADGVTLIPVTRLSFGFGCGGGDYGKQAGASHFGGGSTAGVRVEPVAFLVIKDGITEPTGTAMSLYPNPATDIVTIFGDGFLSATVIDISGRTLLRTTAMQIDISGLRPGEYVVKVERINGETEELKMIKE